MNDQITQWLANARSKLQNGGLHGADLDELLALSQKPKLQTRQRLLYLHANGMSPDSFVISADWCEPVRNAPGFMLSPHPEIPYNTVHEAMIDGWRVIHFPRQSTGADDREVGIFGYEFILEKLEEYEAYDD